MPSTVRSFLVAALLVLAAPAFAQPMTEQYRLDPGFNAGKPFLERFGGVGSNDYRGRFLVGVPDSDDVVVVGEVPGYQQGPNQFGNTNIGMVRYSRNGVRQRMQGGQFYGFGGAPGDQPYVIMPNDPVTRSSGMKALIAVTQVHNGYFYTLTDEYYSVPPEINLLAVRRFRADGAYVNAIYIESNRTVEDREDLHGIDMTFHQDGGAMSLMILARKTWRSPVPPITGCDDGYGCSALLKVTLAADGTQTYDTAYGIRRIGHAPGSVDERAFRPTAIASGPRGNLSPVIYVAGTHRDGTAVPRVKVKKYSSAAEYLSQTLLAFRNVPGRAETGPRMLVRADASNGYHHVYIAAQTEQTCAPGAGVAKINDSGGLVSAFGDGGKLLFGGNDDAPDSQGCAFAKFALPLGLAMDDDGRLAIAGQMSEDVDWNNTYTTGMLAVVDSVHGTLLDFGGHFWRAPNGYPIGHAAFYSVLPTGNGSFTVAGDQRDTAVGNHLMFTTARLVGDALFSDGFE